MNVGFWPRSEKLSAGRDVRSARILRPPFARRKRARDMIGKLYIN